MNYADITIAILCGGESSRMKQDKGLVNFHDRPMVLKILETASVLSKRIILITNNKEYEKFGYPCYEDQFKKLGPVAGIYTALLHTSTKKNLILSCDIPFIQSEFLSLLIENTGAEDVCVPVHGQRKEPLCAVYDKNCLEKIKIIIDSGILKMQDVLVRLDTVYFKVNPNSWNADELFANINTPEELINFQKN